VRDGRRGAQLEDFVNAPYGPNHPHPLSTLKTELVWEGKYDEYGRRREVDVVGCAMPLQKIATIDEPRSAAAAAGQLDLFEKRTSRRFWRWRFWRRRRW